MHAWLTALFGDKAPKPFRYFERKAEVLGYTRHPAQELLEHAQTFAPPQAWAALDAESAASKPMPAHWRVGMQLRLEVLACPVTRRGDEEKDLYLRALDRLGKICKTRF